MSLTLEEMVSEAQERTHFGEEEIRALVEENWPLVDSFRETQLRLLVWLIEKKQKEMTL